MSLATELMRASPIGVKALKNALSKVIAEGKARVVTDRNRPRHFLIPYEDMVELLEIIEELSDPAYLKRMAEGRRAIRQGAKGIPVSRMWRRLGL